MTVLSKPWLSSLLLLGITLWSYWPTLQQMGERWTEDPQYSHGYLVPLFSIYLLWSRFAIAKGALFSPSWLGLASLVVGIGLRAAAGLLFLGFLDAISMLFCLFGVVLITGGRKLLHWSWPAIVFLGFMAPLPYRLQNALGGFLQNIATKLSTFSLQAMGIPAIAEGKVIVLNETRIAVVEACNGLGMLVTFFAISFAFALLVKGGGWWRRVALLLGAIPIAVIANVIRITVTGVLYSASKNDIARIVFHDVAGWLMMPLGILLLLIELRVLDRLVVKQNKNDSVRMPVIFIPEMNRPSPNAS